MSKRDSEIRMVKCPTCRQAVAWLPESIYRPFCSERCKLIDLGAWAEEEYAVEAEENDGFPDIVH